MSNLLADITSALHQLEVTNQQRRDLLSPSHSPYGGSSAESSPCREEAYTPDFEESDSTEEGDGEESSCSSTSGSFECVHNRFKSSGDVSVEPADSEEDVEVEGDGGQRQMSPLKVFSGTWDCHATPTKGVLVTPEKKVKVFFLLFFL